MANTTDDQSNASTGKTPFIDASTAMSAFDESNKWFRPYFDPIEEFERIARNRPSANIPENLPKITDGTIAALVQEDPKRLIQQLATGKVDCYDWPEYAMIADIVHRYDLLPSYSRMGTALQKHWNMLGKAKTWGRSTSYTFMTNTGNKFHTDFVIPYVKDVITEKGKVYAPDSNISFLRSWYQRRDIQAIINREKYLIANKPGYKPEWDLQMLADFMEGGASMKPADQQTPAEKEKGGDAGGYEVIHAMQVGKGAEFYSFAPRFQEGKSMRTKINKDPRGKIPLDHEYYNIDLSNPLGRGSVELSGGLQNLMDQKLQMFQFMMTLMMGPPLQVWGGVDKNKIKFRPNAIWDMGSSANNKVEPYAIDNAAISSFTGDMQFLQSKIYNLNSSNDNSIPADSGNVGQSKTQAGVKAQEAKLGVSDNYVRKQHESWFNDQAETSINIYFAEMTGKDGKIRLEPQDLKDFQRDPKASKYVDKDGVLTIPYKKISDVTFNFTVDASSSEIKDDADNADKLTQALQLIQQSQDPTVKAAEVKVTKLLLDEIGAEGTDDLFPDDQVDENGQPVAGSGQQGLMQQLMPQVQQMVQQMIQESQKQQQPKSLGESVAWKPGDLKPSERAQALAQVGIQADESQAPTPNEVTDATKTALDMTKESHNQALAVHQAASSHAQAMNPQPTDTNGTSSDSNATSTTETAPADESGMHAPDENEQQVVEDLLRSGFSEADVEQGIIMMRQGKTLDEVKQLLGAKYAQQQ